MPAFNTKSDELIIKFLQQSLTGAEEDELNEWISASEENRLLFNKVTSKEFIVDELPKLYAFDEEKGWGKIENNLKSAPKLGRIFSWRKFAAAATVLILLSSGGYFVFKSYFDTQDAKMITVLPRDVKAPENNRAMIILANGQKVYLDSAVNGQLAIQGNVQLVKLANGKIAYKTAEGNIIKEIQNNTLYNPRGSKIIDMTLADGSRVWLNAESSITYPVTFIGAYRKVTISGEAYFEVAHNPKVPFKVALPSIGGTSGGEVTVLGTHFNVNAYKDDNNIKVTLLEGSVAVSSQPSAASVVKLIPDEQALVGSDVKVVKGIDTERVMAWKNGMFDFGESTSLEDIMKQVSRWYDVEIEYNSTINPNFGGSISRMVNVSKVLEKFEMTGRVHFKIEGKKVFVVR